MRHFPFLALLLLTPAAFAQTPNPNPQLVALALAVSGAAPAVSYGSPLADSLVAFLAQLKRHDYAGLGGITQPGATPRPRLGADQLALAQDDDGGITLCLYYLVANRQGKYSFTNPAHLDPLHRRPLRHPGDPMA